jgi:hypothetical protein
LLQLLFIELAGDDQRDLMLLKLIEGEAEPVKVKASQLAHASVGGLANDAGPLEPAAIKIIDRDQITPNQRFDPIEGRAGKMAKQLVERIEGNVKALLGGTVREIDGQA